MLRTFISACAFMALVGASSPALAQENRVSGNLLVGIGSSRAGGSADELATVGVRVTDYVSVNGEIASHSFKGYLSNGLFLRTKHRAFRYGGNVRFGYAEKSLVQPYLTAGIGAINLKKAAGGRATEFTPNVGLGFDLWPSKYVGAGVHYRSLFVDHGTYHTFVAGVIFGVQ
jgi:hypothetical protein